MVNKIEKQLNLTCPTCLSTFQLLEIHQKASSRCSADCRHQWQTLLNKHYQEHIILYLAQEEARKEKSP